MIDNDFFYDGFTEENLNDFIEWSDAVNDSINIADTEETKEKAEKSRKEFYREIESVKIKDIEIAIKEAEESGDNNRKALLERVKQEVQNARREMYRRNAPKVISSLLGLDGRAFFSRNDPRWGAIKSNASLVENRYWDEAEIEDLIFSEQAIDEIKLDKDNFQTISMRTNTDNIEHAIERAEEAGNNEKKEKLLSIKSKIDKLRSSAAIYGYRYQPGKEHSVERKPDEAVLSIIDRMFEDLGQEASAPYGGMNYIYVYLTNARDKTDLLKRLEIVDGKLDKYEEFLKEAYGKGTYKDAMQTAITTAKEDFESRDILGLDEEVESR